MKRVRARLRDERGSAVVEFVFLGVLMMVPLIYLVLMLARVQAGAFAVSAAAREGGRAFVTASDDGSGAARARAAAQLAFEDQRFTSGTQILLACDGSPCLRPEGTVEVRTSVKVPLPLIPAFARSVVPLHVTLESRHLATVDRFREFG